MRSKSTYSASMRAAKVENDTNSSRPFASTDQVARGDGQGKRKAMGIAEVLLPPQIIPNASKSKLASQEEVRVW